MAHLIDCSIEFQNRILIKFIIRWTVLIYAVYFGFISVALANNENRGGGQCVAMSDGSYRFLDMLDPNDFKNTGPNGERAAHPLDRSANDKLWQNGRYVKEIFYSDNKLFPYLDDYRDKERTLIDSEGFFRPRANAFDPIRNLLEPYQSIRSVNYIVNPPIEKKPSASIFSEFRLTQSDEQLSPTFSSRVQEPCAKYVNGVIMISKRIFERLPEKDKLALLVHESLREANFFHLGYSELSTEEIEIATRYLMGLPPRKGSNLNGVLTKLAIRSCKRRIGNYELPYIETENRKQVKYNLLFEMLHFSYTDSQCFRFDIVDKKYVHTCNDKINMQRAKSAFCDARNTLLNNYDEYADKFEKLRYSVSIDDVNRFCDRDDNDHKFNESMYIILNRRFQTIWNGSCQGSHSNNCNRQMQNVKKEVGKSEKEIEDWASYACLRFDDQSDAFIWKCEGNSSR